MRVNEEARRTYETVMARLKNFINFPWLTEMEPYQVIPNVYYVGNRYVGCYLFNTTRGLVLIDTALKETAYLLFDSIRKMGFDPKNIKMVLISHGHVDHCGALRLVKEYSGCEVWFPKGDAFFLDQRRDLILEESHVPPFDVNHYFDYDEPIDLGNFSIQPVHTPGHTPGCTSFLITAKGDEPLVLGLHGGLGLNGLSLAELEENGLPSSLQQDYLKSLEEIRNAPVDIVLPSHLSHYPGDYMALVAQNTDGSGNALRVPNAWKNLIDDRIAQIKKLIESDSQIC